MCNFENHVLNLKINHLFSPLSHSLSFSFSPSLFLPVSYFYICKFFVYSEKNNNNKPQWQAERADEHTMLALALSLALSPSTAANPLVTCKQFACVCMFIHTGIHKYSCTRVTLRRVASSSLPLPSLVRCFCTKSLSQALIISCIRHSDASRFACELWAVIAVGAQGKARKRKFTEGTHLKGL